ncbi:MAG: L-histidine N(alpha)-methyltransferase [bacterium]|nr:L-histidine N(alpha)-methyltransferase [bacterium]
MNTERLTIYHLDNLPRSNSFAEDVKAGLTSQNKFLHPKYFYDNHGSELFEKICETEEYYPTRTELGILKKLSGTISERNRDKNLIVELGSGSSYKTNFILSSFLEDRQRLNYVPIDVSDILIESSEKLIEKYPKLFITGIISFYQEGMEFIVSRDSSPKLVLFLGSSIGNFTEEEQIEFMKMLKGNLSKDDRLLIGFDMVKSREVLEAAYDDSSGVTAEFNLNILRRINNELDADFDLNMFRHIALFNEEKSRIEMHLEAKVDTSVKIAGIDEVIHFNEGERIHTENSYKFTNKMIDNLAKVSGMEFSDCYTDDQNYFSLCAFRPL